MPIELSVLGVCVCVWRSLMRQLHPKSYAPQVSSLIELLLLAPNAATSMLQLQLQLHSTVVIISCIVEALSRFQKLSDRAMNRQRQTETKKEKERGRQVQSRIGRHSAR